MQLRNKAEAEELNSCVMFFCERRWKSQSKVLICKNLKLAVAGAGNRRLRNRGGEGRRVEITLVLDRI